MGPHVGAAAAVVIELARSAEHLRLLAELLRHGLAARGLTVVPTVGGDDPSSAVPAPDGPPCVRAVVTGAAEPGRPAETLHADGGPTPVVVVSPSRDRRLVLPPGPPTAPAAAFVSLQELGSIDELVAVLREVAHDPSAPRPPLERPLPLTDDQLEVARLVARGHGNRRIAELRFTSESAVRNMISRILDRLGLPDDGGANARVILTRAIADAEGARPGPVWLRTVAALGA